VIDCEPTIKTLAILVTMI